MSFKTFKVKKNRHRSRPRKFVIYNKPCALRTSAIFQHDCNYDLKDSDQDDWNKLTGLTYSFNPTHETVMIGWRYNKESKKIELCGYYHVNKERYFTEPLMSVDLGKRVDTYIDIYYEKKEYEISLISNGEIKTHTYEFNHSRRWAKRINLWFGGNEKAPQTVSVRMEYKKQ